MGVGVGGAAACRGLRPNCVVRRLDRGRGAAALTPWICPGHRSLPLPPRRRGDRPPRLRSLPPPPPPLPPPPPPLRREVEEAGGGISSRLRTMAATAMMVTLRETMTSRSPTHTMREVATTHATPLEGGAGTNRKHKARSRCHALRAVVARVVTERAAAPRHQHRLNGLMGAARAGRAGMSG